MHQDPSQSSSHAKFPTDTKEIMKDLRLVRSALRDLGVPNNLLTNISTRAMRSGRRQTGEYQSNRGARWKLKPLDPQFGSELDCRIIEIRLLAMAFQFDDAPELKASVRELLEEKYLGEPIVAGTYRDSLLLERMSFTALIDESKKSTKGSSNFHLGHEDPTITPKHIPSNISWRSHRSNLIQGNMTLRQSRIYLVKLIARYFELGELPID